jgi:hypothetical protein
MIHHKYLPFTTDELRRHFVGDAAKQIAHFQRSAERYSLIEGREAELTSMPLQLAKTPCQMEKDERFWTATALKRLVEAPNAKDVLGQLLRDVYGDVPPLEGLSSWSECLLGELHLILEAVLPAPHAYLAWLRANVARQHFVPYVLRAAAASGVQRLEGPTHVDAVILNQTNGFALCIEAKVLSDISATIEFDAFRNQLVRNIDVMLESHASLTSILAKRRPERSLLMLLTPRCFKTKPESRLYGWLFKEYKETPDAIARDLPHREQLQVARVAKRLGWLTFEDIANRIPTACPWIMEGAA